MPPERDYFERLCFRPTLTINGLHGGYGGPGAKTVLPHEAIAKCDIRLVEAQDTADILRKVEAHVRRHAPEVKFMAAASACSPRKTPLDLAPCGAAAPRRRSPRTASSRCSIRPASAACPATRSPNILGMTAFVTPYGNADEANHAPNENLKLDCFHNGIRTGAALLVGVGRAR